MSCYERGLLYQKIVLLYQKIVLLYQKSVVVPEDSVVVPEDSVVVPEDSVVVPEEGCCTRRGRFCSYEVPSEWCPLRKMTRSVSFVF